MATCLECDSPLDIDVDEVDEGDVILCDECGTEFEVVGTEPLELARVEEEGYDDVDSAVEEEEEE